MKADIAKWGAVIEKAGIPEARLSGSRSQIGRREALMLGAHVHRMPQRGRQDTAS